MLLTFKGFPGVGDAASLIPAGCVKRTDRTAAKLIYVPHTPRFGVQAQASGRTVRPCIARIRIRPDSGGHQ